MRQTPLPFLPLFPRKLRKNQTCGFTLLEVIVAVMLVGVFVSAVIPIYSRLTTRFSQQREQSLAYETIQARLLDAAFRPLSSRETLENLPSCVLVIEPLRQVANGIEAPHQWFSIRVEREQDKAILCEIAYVTHSHGSQP